jgi:hypothetical protein
VTDVKLQPPIWFRSKTDGAGISLRDALSVCNKAKDLDLLKLDDDPNELVLNHGPPSTSIRLQVRIIVIRTPYYYSLTLICESCDLTGSWI